MSSATGIASRDLPEITRRPFTRFERVAFALCRWFGHTPQRYLQRRLFEAHAHFRRLFYISPREVSLDGRVFRLKTIPYVELRTDTEAVFLSMNEEKGAAIFDGTEFHFRGRRYRRLAALFLAAAELRLPVSDVGTE